MHCGSRYFSSLLLAAAFLVPAVTAGCATQSYRVYDPYRNDYHRWDRSENDYYRQWAVQNRRDDRDFRRLDRHQQEEYWKWRHSHDDHDRHHDRDHDHDHDRH